MDIWPQRHCVHLTPLYRETGERRCRLGQTDSHSWLSDWLSTVCSHLQSSFTNLCSSDVELCMTITNHSYKDSTKIIFGGSNWASTPPLDYLLLTLHDMVRLTMVTKDYSYLSWSILFLLIHWYKVLIMFVSACASLLLSIGPGEHSD